MAEKGRDSIDFGRDGIWALFRALFFPTLIGMIFNSALTIIDGVFVGQGVGADGFAAVNIVAPIFMVSTGIGLLFGIGSSVVASIHLARNNAKAARIIMTQAMIVGVLIISAIIVLSLCFTDSLLGILGCSGRLKANATDYLLWLLPGLFFLFLQCVGMMLVRLDGSPRYAMWVQVVAAVVNIVLDWYMIFPLGMGVMGAAMATSIACMVAGLMVLAYFIWFSTTLKFYRLKLSKTSLLLTLRNCGYMARIGFATFLTELAMGVMMLSGNYMFMKMLHEEGVAAFAVACYLFPVVFSISNAVAQSAQPIISFNYGAGQSRRVSKTLRVSVVTAIVCGILISIGLWLSAPAITSMFLSRSETAFSLAVGGLPLFALCAVPFALNIAFIGYYQSIEKAGAAITYTALRGIFILVPSFMLLPVLIGVPGLWLAIPVAETITLAIIVSAYLVVRRRKDYSSRATA